jgi:hypothetical protein
MSVGFIENGSTRFRFLDLVFCDFWLVLLWVFCEFDFWGEGVDAGLFLVLGCGLGFIWLVLWVWAHFSTWLWLRSNSSIKSLSFRRTMFLYKLGNFKRLILEVELILNLKGELEKHLVEITFANSITKKSVVKRHLYIKLLSDILFFLSEDFFYNKLIVSKKP